LQGHEKNWEDLRGLSSHIEYEHRCLFCGVRFCDPNRKTSHIAHFHGYRWGWPEGITIGNGSLVLTVSGWERPKKLPKTVDEFYEMVAPFFLAARIPEAGIHMTLSFNEPDIHGSVEGWRQPTDPLETPSGIAERCRWLEPLSVKLLESEWPEQVLEKFPRGLETQSNYVELHWERVNEFLSLERYGPERYNVKRRGQILTIALTCLQGSASYVIQRYEVHNAQRNKEKNER
jgi:hypothetical protein